jgi:hypothetical protein
VSTPATCSSIEVNQGYRDRNGLPEVFSLYGEESSGVGLFQSASRDILKTGYEWKLRQSLRNPGRLQLGDGFSMGSL